MDPGAGLDDVEILTLPGLEARLLDRPVRSLSLYRLRYPDSQVLVFISPRHRVVQLYPQALDYFTQPAWRPRYVALGRTQQQTPSPTFSLLLLWAVV
jgi:hypothetical protein